MAHCFYAVSALGLWLPQKGLCSIMPGLDPFIAGCFSKLGCAVTLTWTLLLILQNGSSLDGSWWYFLPIWKMVGNKLGV